MALTRRSERNLSSPPVFHLLMMSCKEFQAQFNARLDERLEAAATVAFDAHRAGCAACRQEWQAYADAWQILARHEALSPSVGFADRAFSSRMRSSSSEGS